MLLENLDTKRITFAVLFGCYAFVAWGAQTGARPTEQSKQDVEVITFNDYQRATLESLVKSADAIIVGTVTGSGAFLLDGRVFTDYDVSVERVVRRVPSSRVSPGGVVVIRRPMGTVTVNGNDIVGEEAGFPPFTAGARYVLFLTPGEGGEFYGVAYGAQGAFALANGIVRQLSEESQLWSQERGALTFDRFLQEVQKVPFTPR